MIKKLTVIAGVFVISMFGSNASALTLASPGVVGAVHGQPGSSDVASETIIGQFILDMLMNTTDSNGPAAGGGGGVGGCNISTAVNCYATSATEYSGTLTAANNSTGTPQGAEHDFTVDAGFEYALAKYDGPNGGYVLFFLGGAATALPDPSSPLWGTGGQYQISHFTTFNATSVPDGGLTAALLGLSMFGLGVAKRRIGRK